ncbi:AAA family ATPase [Mesosutterella sp. OilRF-GAM-744-9]|uniref:AAA family ATPase n=1 Tax=Mesosutterella porci TaxID=2915351 RepID=A0ABS9MRN5_9BURK|nr:AAA family ATPase [Mesosutterella sp. oilRF-744-WT-GAM-9]MCG5030668.1 AAA family ATPase [Mesosutterella sp. oilRF-744-WT-GAM-9]
MIIAVANIKGGVGKTNIAVSIATYLLTQKAKTVFLVDTDEQESASMALKVRKMLGVKPAVPFKLITEAKELSWNLEELKKQYDYVIVDAGGRDTEALRATLLRTDILLVPCPPGSTDIWSFKKKLGRIVADARKIGGKFKAYSFLSRADAKLGSADNINAQKIIEQVPEFKFVDARIVNRKAYGIALGSGKSVFELRPRDIKACNEIRYLVEKTIPL